MANNKVSVQVIDGLEPILDKKADDSTVVHKTGDETIDGNKTFTSSVDIKRPLSGGATRYSIKDTNNKGMSSLDAYYVGNSVYARLLTENYTASKGAWLEIQNNDNGKAILNCSHIDTTSGFPNPSASANGSEIATTSWVNDKKYAVDSNVVHKTGDETIEGLKTFKDKIWLRSNEITTEAQMNPSKLLPFYFVDKNGHACGTVEFWNTKDYNKIILNVQGKDKNWARALELVKHNNGNSIAYAPTPSIAYNSDEIVTCKWVNTKFQIVSALPAKPDSNVFYCIPE